MDPPGSESSPGLSRRSTSSSGIEADARQHSLSAEMGSMEEEGQRQAENCLGSAASRGSARTSGFHTGRRARIEDEGWQEEGERILFLFFHVIVILNAHMATSEERCFPNLISQMFLFPEIKSDIGSPKGVLVDSPDEMFQLADLLEGVSVDCSELSSETLASGMNHLIMT